MSAKTDSPQFISVRDRRFVDTKGRHVVLHGISLVNKDPSVGYLGDEGLEVFAAMRDWGFNCVRLGVIWDGLEPEPGVYNEEYMQGIDRQIAWAKENGLVVFLDMHQDLYSVSYSDGAPEWATLADGAPHVSDSDVWSDAYFTSPAVQAALDNFWANAPARDGLGLQDHYARAWATLAQRYVDEAAVIGYDLMNEPFPGSLARQAQGMMFAKGAQRFAALNDVAPEGADSPAEDLAQRWLTPQGRYEILQLLRNVDIYAQIIDVTEPLYAEFERTTLMAMYRRAARAIRHLDRKHILFLETTMASNMGVYSGIEPLVGESGTRDARQAYAPHGYDLVTDTPNLAQASPERIELIFERHGETAERLGMPMLVGEWGAYGRNPGTLPAAWHVVHQFEKLLCSETYWAYEPGMERFPCFQAIHRPYPERVAGTLLGYHYDPTTGVLSSTWEEDGHIPAPSRLYLPDWFGFDAHKFELTPTASGFEIAETHPGSGNTYLIVPPTGRACTRRLVVWH